MPFPMEMVFPERIKIGVCLMIASIVHIFESVQVQLSLLSFQPWRVSFCISLTAPHKVMVVLSLVRTIVFYIPKVLNSTREDCMFLFPTILTLWYNWVYICFVNSVDIASNIEVPIYESFDFVTTLNIPDVQPDNSHVRL